MSESYYGSEQQAIDLGNTAGTLAEQVAGREKSYKGSWQSRGGVGAFMMLARKWDRMATVWAKLEASAKDHGYDIWEVWDEMEEFADGEMNDIEDLAGYLLHVINEMRTVRPRRLEQEYEEAQITDIALSPEELQNLDELRLTEKEWRVLDNTGSVTVKHKGRMATVTRITQEDIINDACSPDCCCPYEVTLTVTGLDDIARDIGRQAAQTEDRGVDAQGFPLTPMVPGFRHAPASAAEGLVLNPTGGPVNPPETTFEQGAELEAQHGLGQVDPNSWAASHPHNYPSAGLQCPQCNATSPKSTGESCTCRQCGCVFPKKKQESSFDQKFPQAMIMRGKNAPETDTIIKG